MLAAYVAFGARVTKRLFKDTSDQGCEIAARNFYGHRVCIYLRHFYTMGPESYRIR